MSVLDEAAALRICRQTLLRLAQALTDRSHDHYRGRREVVAFAAATAARIGEASGIRVCDIDTALYSRSCREVTSSSA
ncbi:hypothetical protein ACFCZY_27410 [Streptomyces sp. NPDC056237]|uniref:hypothetical protein n=1 Tax=unclassified Streptomyces TaxID=2593676 RepID=UPI0035DC19E2